MPGVVTVAIPVLDGARYLDEVLAAVRAQVVDREVELLIADSGSTDGSLDIARRHEARVHAIPRAEFSHGGTRNLLMRLARGDHVAFLTQDATPAHAGWLAALLEGFSLADDVAAAFGPHIPRPGASHMIRSEMGRHFAVWGDGGRQIDLHRLDRSPAGVADYRAFPGRISFLSSVNCCLARRAWEAVPFREVPYAEDQLLGRELVEHGYAKVFHPEAAVFHSHDYPPWGFFRRYFDEWRSLREVLGHVQPAGPKTLVWDVRGLVGADKRWLRAHGVGGRALARPLARSARHHAIRVTAAAVGSRADRVPAAARRRLSLEGRGTFSPVEIDTGPVLGRGAAPGTGPVEVRPDWGWEFVRRAYPARPIATEPHSGRAEGPLTLAWVVPVWKVGSGGHMTLFRLVAELERRGHRCAIHVFDPFKREQRPAWKLRREILDSFLPVEASVFRGLSDFHGADVAIATNWWTAWPVRDLGGCREKVYLVQDDERQFHPTSAASLWAAETYRMGYRCIAYTRWMADLLQRDYGVETRWFECGTDLDTYRFAGEAGREPGLVAVYARRETERRAVDLALAGLGTLWERRPGTRVVLYGSRSKTATPFPAENLGVLSPAELAGLYRRASAGVVLSLTTHSLVAQEMMASGLPLVELDGENVTSELGGSGENAVLVPPRPDALADALARLLDDRAGASELAARARAWVAPRTWERAADQVEAALRDYLARPRPLT
jgi:glycosyltransferase involved in cell wall biosynthesis